MNIVMRFPEGRFKTLTFSYDDGSPADERLCKILHSFGLKGTFNLSSCWSGNENAKPDIYKPLGHEVAMHTFSHLMIAGLPDSVMADEIVSDKKTLEKTYGGIIKGGAYPFGDYSQKVEEVLRLSGIKYFRMTSPTHNFNMPKNWLTLFPTCHHNDSELLSLGEKFLELKKNPERWWESVPKMFYVWGHSHEFDREDNWDLIEKFAEFISGKDDIWYATNGEIYSYTEAFLRLEFSTDGKTVHNPTAQKLWLCADGKELCINSGETLNIE